ncbi:DUF5719 family protein [Amnibacterium kyonggiense]|uniref:Large extracellular alpha-helical protein n=1 Tax=Amnibacterium kyonggiense TaxID=595671 RepID=A0A4R7FGW7_9MICO|nr:DUF5719 family protein [Amnibacterium kyonggiense]TDS74850.1 hypothetical protein CLV52_3372 [Amnibacterium kyonggiense]
MALNGRAIGASALVAAGVAAAAIVGQLPAFGSADQTMTVTPSSAPQSLLCPGPAIAVGADPADANALSATGKPARVAGTAKGAKPKTVVLGRGEVSGGAAPRALSAAASDRTGVLAGAQVEQVTLGDAAGLAAASCTAPASDVWFAAGATTTGRTTVLTLANPSPVAAQVGVRVWTENGPVDAASFSELVVPAKGRTAVSLAGVAPSAGGTVVRVTSTGGRVGAALEQRTVRGLESGGLDMTGPTTAPALEQVVPGVRVLDAAAVASAQRADDYADLQTVVRVLVPGSAATDVSITATPDGGGQPVTLGRRVAGGVVTDFPVTGLPDGTYTVRVTGKRALVAGVRTAVVGDASGSVTPTDQPPASDSTSGGAAVGSDAGLVGGDGPVDASGAQTSSTADTSATSTARGIDFAWFAAAPELSGSAAIAVVDAPSPILSIANPGAARTVRLSGPVSRTVRVPAKGSVAVPVTRGVVVLSGAAGLRAAVSYAGDDALAGYPAAAADQQAHPVRISR